MSDSGPTLIEQKALQYLDVQAEIDALEILAGALRDDIKVSLDGAPEGHSWDFQACKVTVVKGRVMERITKESLVKAGVLPEAIGRATIRTTLAPTLRITRVTGKIE